MNSSLFTLSREGTLIRTEHELGRGGEGTVFAIEGRSDRALKLYSRPPEQGQAEKLLRMAEVSTPSLLKVAAWPVDLAIDRSGLLRGFVMPRISARRSIDELYRPKSRAQVFPAADFRFLVHVATNLARALAVVHAEGHIVGDLNPKNVLVGPDGTVMLIDCDSFQVRCGTRIYTCDVGQPLFTAPELQGRHLRGVQRTSDQDLFALAVLLFHILFVGRHPFAGRYSGPKADMPIEEAIREYRFAYGPDRAKHGMDRPPHTIPLETMGAAIASLFVSAFGPIGSGARRPSASTWIGALDHLGKGLCVCSRAAWHHFPRTLASCPWCNVEQTTGVRLFGQKVTVSPAVGAVDVAALWGLITGVAGPGPDPPLPSQTPPLPRDVVVRQAKKLARQMLALGMVAAGVVAWATLGGAGILLGLLSAWLASVAWPRPSPERVSEADREVAAARQCWQSACARWAQEASVEAFKAQLIRLEKLRDELIDLPNEHKRRLSRLESDREARQRNRYLDRFHISRANVRGIGPGRTAMLAAYGIETAADVDPSRILLIPGFGPVLTAELLGWRAAHERNFRFNPDDPAHHADIAALERDMEVRRQALIGELAKAPAVLRRLASDIESARPRLMPVVAAAWAALKTAEARRAAL